MIFSSDCPHCGTPYLGDTDERGRPLCNCDGAKIERLEEENRILRQQVENLDKKFFELEKFVRETYTRMLLKF